MKRTQKGFTTLEMLFVLVILGIIGFTGYYVYHSKQQTDKTLNTAQDETSAVKVSKKAIVIKEWGVSIPMPSTVNLSDIYYVVGSDASGNQVANLGSTKLDVILSACNVKTTGYTPFGEIERMAPADYQTASQDSQDTGVTSGVKLGSYYYVWQAPRGNCFEAAADSNATMATQISQLMPDNQLIDNFPTNMPTVLAKIETTN